MIKLNPAPTWIPLTTGIGIVLVNHWSRPVMLKTRMQHATKIPAAAVCPAVRDFSIATAAIAFIGCTGSGMPKTMPVRMLNMPVKIKVVGSEI